MSSQLVDYNMMMRVAFLLTLMASLALPGVLGLSNNNGNKMSLARRAFLVKFPASAATLAIGTTMGQFFSLESTNQGDHSQACNCDKCVTNKSWFSFRPPSASAYEPRPVGGDNPSPVIASFNIQSAKTYDRLEKDGFSLDTREEESARLSEALSSFAYPSPSTKDVKKDEKKSFDSAKSYKTN
jgi:hypothetical protein